LLALSGCVASSRTGFPVEQGAQAEISSENIAIIKLTPQNIGQFTRPKPTPHSDARLPDQGGKWQYLVGVGDVLSITVWDHPELTLPAGPERSQVESGSWVNAEGVIFYPYIGNLDAAGRSIGAIQQELAQRLAEYIPDPQVEVKVAQFNAHKVLVTGAILRPGTVKISNIPLTLLEAVNTSGGLTDAANSTHVTVKRNGHTYYIHLRAFLAGVQGGNPVLRGGDIVNVPVLENNAAYVLGQVETPGSVALGPEGVNLTDALTTHGGLQENTADAKGIFVFRSRDAGAGIDVFQLDASTPLAFVLATKFILHPQDVVYVVTDPAVEWNAAVARLLPSISAIRGVQVIGGGA